LYSGLRSVLALGSELGLGIVHAKGLFAIADCCCINNDDDGYCAIAVRVYRRAHLTFCIGQR